MTVAGFIRPMLALAIATSLASAAARELPDGGIGLESELTVVMDRGDYRPKPLDDRTPLILRQEEVKPAGDGHFSYRFHYIAFEPGSYRLAEYLVQPDGSPAAEASGVMIDTSAILVDSVLPPDFSGTLHSFDAQPFPWFGGYRMMLGGLALLWLACLPALIWLGRKKQAAAVEEVSAPPPTYAERMLPYVEDAAAGRLTAAGQAELERLMTGYWREKVADPAPRMAGALAALKKHPEAGPLLHALESWLHRPGNTPRAEIERLLEPYRRPLPTGEEARA